MKKSPHKDPTVHYYTAHYNPKYHSMLRRKKDHDYSSRCIYLVTVMKSDNTIPAFSSFATIDNPGFDNIPPLIDSPLGTIIRACILQTEQNYPQVSIPSFVIMPDHIHLIINVKDTLPNKLGGLIGDLKNKIRKEYNTYLSDKTGKPSYLKPLRRKYNDEILFYRNQLDNWFFYIKDNPRRLFLKRLCGDLFKIGYEVKSAFLKNWGRRGRSLGMDLGSDRKEHTEVCDCRSEAEAAQECERKVISIHPHTE